MTNLPEVEESKRADGLVFNGISSWLGQGIHWRCWTRVR